MSISGLCQVCETRQAEHQCTNCGALVCDVDFERGPGLCVNCAAGVQGGEPTL